MVDFEKIKTNRILALSGGGVKGIAELIILAEIEKRTQKKVSELFTIISGTSVGGLNAVLLTMPKANGLKEPKYTAQAVLELFKDAIPIIFQKQPFSKIRQIFTSKYSNKQLINILDSYVGTTRFNNAISRVIIPVADLDNENIKIFDSYDKYSLHIRSRDVLLATTAAPTFFKPITNHKYIKNFKNIKIEEIRYAYADGSIGANRPAHTVLQILKSCNSNDQSCIRGTYNRHVQNNILDKTMVVSINFKNPKEQNSTSFFTGSGGILDWIAGRNNLVNRILSISQNNATLQVKNDLPGENDFIDILLPITKETQNLDNASKDNIEALELLTKKYINDNNDFIQKTCDVLLHHYTQSQKQDLPPTVETSDSSISLDQEQKPIGKYTQQYLEEGKETNNGWCIIN